MNKEELNKAVQEFKDLEHTFIDELKEKVEHIHGDQLPYRKKGYARCILRLKSNDDIDWLESWQLKLRDAYQATKEKTVSRDFARFPELHHNISQINLTSSQAHSSSKLKDDDESRLTLFSTTKLDVAMDLAGALDRVGLNYETEEREVLSIPSLVVTVKESDLISFLSEKLKIKATAGLTFHARRKTGQQWTAMLRVGDNALSKERYGVMVLSSESKAQINTTLRQKSRTDKLHNRSDVTFISLEKLLKREIKGVPEWEFYVKS